MGELVDGQPLFPGDSEIDQLYIVQVQRDSGGEQGIAAARQRASPTYLLARVYFVVLGWKCRASCSQRSSRGSPHQGFKAGQGYSVPGAWEKYGNDGIAVGQEVHRGTKVSHIVQT